MKLDGILDGVSVVDLSAGPAGAVAALVLAEAGADVTLVREPGRPTLLDPAAAAIWHRSKRVVDLDLATPPGRAALDALLDRVHLLVSDRTPAEALRDGLDPARLRERWPRLHPVAIGGWPRGHALEDRQVDDSTVLAESGLLDEQLAGSRAGPVYPRFPLGSAVAGLLAVVGALAVLRGKPGVAVDTSLLQGALLPMMMYWGRAEHPTLAMRLGMPKDNPASLLRCADGAWMHVMPDPNRCAALREAVEAMDPDRRATANARYAGVPIPWFDNRGALEEIFATRPRAHWLALLREADVPVDAVQPLGALYLDEQAADNGYVVEVDTPGWGRTLQPAVPLHVQPPMRVRGGARATAAASEVPRRFGEGLPLKGLRVLDFGNFLAGPLASMLMADLGAEVIKVEAVTGDPLRPADWAFNACQRGKRSLALDLRNPASRPILRRLVESADVVHHNLRMPAAIKLGLGPDELLALKPSLVSAHVSAYGAVGPRRDWPGYDQLFQASSGWEEANAGRGQAPVWYRFGMMDHLAAVMSVASVLLALRVRDATGCGQHVSASLLGASVFTLDAPADLGGRWLGTTALDEDALGVAPARRLMACRDGWVVLAAHPGDETAVQRWALACGVSERELVALARGRDTAAVLASLERAGVPAARVADSRRDAFLDDPAHRAQTLSVALPHATFGELAMPGAMWRVDGAPACAATAPPRLGEHSRDILAGLGFETARIDDWVASGLVRQLPA